MDAPARSRGQNLADVLRHVEAMSSDVASMRRSVTAEELATTDRQYLLRCFELLEMELGAVRDYVVGMK